VSTPSDDRPAWQPPGDDPARPAYGSPQSPSYGKYGQGAAEPPAPPAPVAPTALTAPAPVTPAPGYGSPAGGPVPGAPSPFTRISGLGTAAWVLAAVVTGLYWAAAALAPAAQRRYTEAADRGESITDLVTGYDLIGALTTAVLLGAWVVTGVWLLRAQRNAMAVHPGGQRRAPVWAWLGWVMPVVSWWFPKQILDDTGATVATATARARRSTGLYWAAWVVTIVLRGIEARLAMVSDPADAVQPLLTLAIAVTSSLALALWIPLVRGLSADCDAMTEGRRP
jgi:hypothetical protein